MFADEKLRMAFLHRVSCVREDSETLGVREVVQHGAHEVCTSTQNRLVRLYVD